MKVRCDDFEALHRAPYQYVLALSGGGTGVLVDPWFLPGHPDYGQQPLGPGQLPGIEAIFLTHEHWDHVNAESVLRYPSDVPIVVPRQDPVSPLYPRYREYLGLFGCDRVIELGHWEQISLPGGRIEPEDEGPAGAALREARQDREVPRHDRRARVPHRRRSR